MIIKIDGIDGCGKTTLAEALYYKYGADNSALTSEFGTKFDFDISVGRQSYSVSNLIRTIALGKDLCIDDNERQALMSVISRRNNRIVIPELCRKKAYVFVDRSNLSNYAYGIALNKKFRCIYSLLTDSVEKYDLLIWIDTPLEVCMERLAKKSADAVEEKGISYFHKVHKNYCDLYLALRQDGKNIYRLDGTKSIEELVNISAELIEKLT